MALTALGQEHSDLPAIGARKSQPMMSQATPMPGNVYKIALRRQSASGKKSGIVPDGLYVKGHRCGQ